MRLKRIEVQDLKSDTTWQRAAIVVLPGVQAEPWEQIGHRFDEALSPYGQRLYLRYAGLGFNGVKTAQEVGRIVRELLPDVQRTIVIGASIGTLVAALANLPDKRLLAIDPPGGVESLNGAPNRLFTRYFAPPLASVVRLAGQVQFIEFIGRHPELVEEGLRGVDVRGIRCPDSDEELNKVLIPEKAAQWWHKVAPEMPWREVPGLHCDFENKLGAYREVIVNAVEELARALGAISLWISGRPSGLPLHVLAHFSLLMILDRD